jgi:hypothetical protein
VEVLLTCQRIIRASAHSVPGREHAWRPAVAALPGLHPADVGHMSDLSRRQWAILTLCIVLGLVWMHIAGTLTSVFVSAGLWAVLVIVMVQRS